MGRYDFISTGFGSFGLEPERRLVSMVSIRQKNWGVVEELADPRLLLRRRKQPKAEFLILVWANMNVGRCGHNFFKYPVQVLCRVSVQAHYRTEVGVAGLHQGYPVQHRGFLSEFVGEHFMAVVLSQADTSGNADPALGFTLECKDVLGQVETWFWLPAQHSPPQPLLEQVGGVPVGISTGGVPVQVLPRFKVHYVVGAAFKERLLKLRGDQVVGRTDDLGQVADHVGIVFPTAEGAKNHHRNSHSPRRIIGGGHGRVHGLGS